MTKIRKGQAPAPLTRAEFHERFVVRFYDPAYAAESDAMHGDVAGAEGHRRNLSDWLEWMGLIDAGVAAKLDRYIGFYEPYYNSHDTLDKDHAVQEEVRNVARAVVAAVKEIRAGRLSQPDKRIKWPRPK